jgi:dTDP-4-amino-4,6-dideoxygalactose transaminase
MTINVTKTFLPPFEEYTRQLKRAWDNAWITNNGELVQELEQMLKDYLGVKHLLFCSNGTIALQMAIKALDITGDVITTPFSYVATTGAILWEGCTPVFVDIDRKTFCIDAGKIEASITPNTQAILATHVYGLPCDTEKIHALASKYHLRVIYDGAHAFGCEYKGMSLLSYGEVSVCSFHATKIFHTAEGGCIICHTDELYEKLSLLRSFGHRGDTYYSKGINAKNSELHAAMGLSVLPYVGSLIQKHKQIFQWYKAWFNQYPSAILAFNEEELSYNYGYFPFLFESEKLLLAVKNLLEANSIYPRRYFYPALNKLPYLSFTGNCQVGEDISKRILCLPMQADLSEKDVDKISTLVLKAIRG